jgi:hypothetical protein
MRRNAERGSERAEESLIVEARIIGDAPGQAARLSRIDHPTPYFLETITDDACRARPGARLELTVPPGYSGATVVQLLAGLAPLRRRGVTVTIRRGRTSFGPLGSPQ